MDIGFFREYCLSEVGATEEIPFGLNTLYFKVGGKTFPMIDIERFESVNLKCDSEYAIDERTKHSSHNRFLQE